MGTPTKYPGQPGAPDVPRGNRTVAHIPGVSSTWPLLGHVVLWRRADYHVHFLEYDSQLFFRSEVANVGLSGFVPRWRLAFEPAPFSRVLQPVRRGSVEWPEDRRCSSAVLGRPGWTTQSPSVARSRHAASLWYEGTEEAARRGPKAATSMARGRGVRATGPEITRNKTRVKLTAAAIAVALCALALPGGVHWRLYGWARGEPFWDGRPASYWGQQIKRLHFTAGEFAREGSYDVEHLPPPTGPVWFARSPQIIGSGRQSLRLAERRDRLPAVL